MAYTQVLKDVFDNKLEPKTIARLKSIANVKTYPKETVLCHQGKVEHVLYILVEGKVSATQEVKNGDTRLLGMIGPNEYFGEMGLIDDRPRIANCKTMTDVTVLEIAENEFNILVFFFYLFYRAYNTFRMAVGCIYNNNINISINQPLNPVFHVRPHTDSRSHS